MLRGYVDNFVKNTIFGWAFNSDFPDEHLIIRILRGNEEVATGIANIMRPDLPAAGAGAGDHAFKVMLPFERRSLNGLIVVAKSESHGEIVLAVATQEDHIVSEVYDEVVRRFESDLADVRTALEALKNYEAPATEQEIVKRLVAVESRIEEAEVFFIRIDEMIRQLVEDKKRRRRRFLGIF